MGSGTVFSTLYFLCNLLMGPIIKSFISWQDFPAQFKVTHQPIEKKNRLLRKQIVVKMDLGSIFTILQFLQNSQMVLLSQIICSWQAFPYWCNVTHQLIEQNCKLHRKQSVVKMDPGSIFTRLQFLRNLQMGLISQYICSWQAFPYWCNVTHQLIEHDCKL